MAAKRSVVVAAGVSAALIASTGAFAVANGLLGDRPADRVGTFQPTAELRLMPADFDAAPLSEPTPATARGNDKEPDTDSAGNHATPADTAQPPKSGTHNATAGGPGDHSTNDGTAVQPPPPATAAPSSPTTARRGDGSSGSDDHGTGDGTDDGTKGDD